MAALQILRNLHQFATILQQSVSAEVKKWNSLSLHNALKWADYAQEVSHHTVGRSCEADIDVKLCEMTLLLRPIGCLRLTVEGLANAKETLTQNLLCNPHLSPSVRQILVTTLRHSDGSAVMLGKVMHRLHSASEERRMMNWLMRTLDTEKSHQTSRNMEDRPHDQTQCMRHMRSECKGQCGDLSDLRCMAQARLVADHLVYVWEATPRYDRLEQYLGELLDAVSKNRCWDIAACLVCVLSGHGESHTDHVRLHILSCVMSWLAVGLKASDFESPLTVSSPALMCEASCQSPAFLSLHLQALTCCADAFLPFIDTDGQVTWRSTNGGDLSVVSQHFIKLLDFEDSKNNKKDPGTETHESYFKKESIAEQTKGCGSVRQSRVKADTVGLLTKHINQGGLNVWSVLGKSILHSIRSIHR